MGSSSVLFYSLALEAFIPQGPPTSFNNVQVVQMFRIHTTRLSELNSTTYPYPKYLPYKSPPCLLLVYEGRPEDKRRLHYHFEEHMEKSRYLT